MMGGLDRLAERLRLPERQLDYWMRDIGTPPDTVFFDVIDIIIERAGKRTVERRWPFRCLQNRGLENPS